MSVTVQATIDDLDFPVFQSLFRKYRVETTIVEASSQTGLTPNRETLQAIEEGDKWVEDYKKGLVQGYTNVEEMFEDILAEDE